MRICTIVLTLLCACAAPTTLSTPAPPAATQEEIAGATLASTVVISNGSGIGAGWFVDPWTVVTARHVAASPGIEVVTQNGDVCDQLGATTSLTADIALIRVAGCRAPAILGEYSLAPLTGRRVMAAGHPMGETYAVTDGVVAAVGRRSHFGRHLLITALALPGMSGGPVVDLTGRVVGVLVAGVPGGTGGMTIVVSAQEVVVEMRRARSLLPAPEVLNDAAAPSVRTTPLEL